MSSKRITTKAHANCAGGSDGDFSKPGTNLPVLKKNLKTPCKSIQSVVHKRNVSRVKISTVKSLKKYSSCQNLNVTQKVTTVSQCKKSKSYENLVPKYQSESLICKFRKTKKVMGDDRDTTVPVSIVGNRLIKEACTAFLLNAWRHRRQEVADIKQKIKALENQTTDLRVQIMSLWQLLESEKNRLAQANLKTMQQHALAEDAIINNKNLKAMNSNQQKEIGELNKEILLLRTECNNQKNELIVSKQEIFSLHNQMDKERVKVTKLREDKKILLDKAHAAEAEAKKKGILLVQAQNEQKEREEAEMVIIQNLHERNVMIDEVKNEKAVIESELEKKIAENEILTAKLTQLEKIIQEKDKEIETLKLTTEKYMVEAVQMRLATLKQDETDNNWAINAGKRISASLIMALIPLVQSIAFP